MRDRTAEGHQTRRKSHHGRRSLAGRRAIGTIFEPIGAKFVGLERLEDRTLLTALDPSQVAALIGPINTQSQTGGGLTALQAWAGQLTSTADFAQTLPIVDQSLGQLIDLGDQVQTLLLTPASSYLGGSNPTAEGLLSALKSAEASSGATGSTSDSFTNNAGVYTFSIPSLTVTATTSVGVDLGSIAANDNISLDAPLDVNLTTTMNLDLSFRINTNNSNAFSVTLSTVSLSTAFSASSLNLGLNFGILGGQVQNGSLSLTAGAGAAFDTTGAQSVADLLASEASPTTTVSITPTMQSNVTGSLPTTFTLGGNTLSSNQLPTISLSDTDPFDGTPVAVATTHFGNLTEFANLSAGDLMTDLQNLGSTFSQLSNTADFSNALPFASGKTVGSVLNFGGAFNQSVISGLQTLPTPSTAPSVVANGGGSTGGQLPSGTYFVEATYATAYGQSAPSPVSSSFTVTSGQIPQVTLPTIPSGDTVDLYLSDSTATSGSATLYESGITSSTVVLNLAPPQDGAAAPTSATSSALFGSAQELATLLGNELATTSGTPYPVDVRFEPMSGSNPDELLFNVGFTDQMPSVNAPVDLNLELGALSGISSNATLQIMPTITMGLTFGIDLDPSAASLVGTTPPAPELVGQPLSDPPANGQLGDDASFSLTIGSNSPITIDLLESVTDNLTSIDNPNNPDDASTLVGQLNLALQGETFGTGHLSDYVVAGLQDSNITFTLLKYDQGNSLTISVPDSSTNPMATVLGFSDGQNATVSNGNGTVSTPIPSDGQLGEASSFTLVIGSNSYNVSLSQAATSSDTSIVNPANADDPSTLVGQLNLALATAGISSEVAASDVDGNIEFTLQGFDLGSTLQIDFGSTDPMGTVLGFTDGQEVHAKSGDLFIENATASASVSLAVTNTTGAAFGTASVGPVALSIENATFSASGSIAVDFNGGQSIDLTDLGTDLTSLAGTESVIQVTPNARFSTNLSGFSIAPGGSFTDTLTAPPSATITALDPLDTSNQFSLADSSQGRIGSDLDFQFQVDGGSIQSIEIPESVTSSNTTVSQLVTEINAALLAADPTDDVEASIIADVSGTSAIAFALPENAPSGSSLVVNNFVGVEYTNFSQLTSFQGLNLSSVTQAIAQTFSAFGQQNSLGYLNETLPVIDQSVYSLVPYLQELSGPLQQLENTTPTTIQAYGSTLATLFGLPSNDLSLSYDPTTRALKLEFTDTMPAYNEYLSLALNLMSLAADATSATAQADLQGLASLIDLSGKSRIHVEADATFTLDLGMSFAGSGAPTAFLYNDTGVQITDLMVAQAATFNASIGAADLAIQNGSVIFSSDGVSTTTPATFSETIKTSVTDPSLAQFSANVAQDTTIGLNGGASVSLPISLASGGSLGTFSAAIGDVKNYLNSTPHTITITTPNLKADLASLGNLNTMLDDKQEFLLPLNSLLNDLESTLSTQLGSEELPLAGTNLGDATGFLTTIQNAILSPLQSAIKLTTGTAIANVQSALLTALQTIDPSATVTVQNLDNGATVEFDIQLSGTITESLPFDIALPVTNFSLNGNESASFAWTLNLDVGLNTSTGFYLIAQPHADPTNPNSAIIPIITENVSITLPASSYTGVLGFLDVTATNNPANTSGITQPDEPNLAQLTGLLGTLDVALFPSGSLNDGRLPISEITATSINDMTVAELNATTWVNMHLVTSVGDGSMFPTFDLDLVMDWPLPDYILGEGNLGNTTSAVSYENVQVGLGTFISEFVSPLLDKIKPILDDIKPIVDFLTTRLPVISDLAGETVTMATIAETLDPDDANEIKTFLSIYETLYGLINDVDGAGGGDLMIDLGTYDLNDLLGDPAEIQPDSFFQINENLLPPAPNPGQQAEDKGASENQAKFTKTATESGGSLTFPILDDPDTVIKMLLGQPVDLFLFNSPTLTFGFDYSKKFPIYGPLEAVLEGNVSASIQVSFGYDTEGIIEWAHSGFAASESIPDLADGFFLVADGSPNIELDAGIAAGAELNVGLASANLVGGIYASIDMTLNDPDDSGKLRFETFASELVNDPLDIFDISGSIYAQLTATLTLGVGVFSISHTFNITPEITIVSFSYVPPGSPDLADISQDGTLALNTGPDSDLRENGNTNQADQSFTVSHEGGTAGDETVDVSSQGETTEYTGVSEVTAEGGLGNDNIDMSGVESNTTITGGQGKNTIVGGEGYNTLVEDQFTDYDLTSGGLTMDGSNSDKFSNIQDVQLSGPENGGADIKVDGYVGNSTLTGHSGHNQFHVNLSHDGTTTIVDSGDPSAPDTIAITLADGENTTISPTQVVQGVNTIDYSADPNLSSLTVNGLQVDTNFTISNTPGPEVQTTLNTGDGDDTVVVEQTSGPTIVNAGAGDDTINVGSLGAGPDGVLSTIQGALTVNTVIGNATLNLDNTGDHASRTALLTDTTLTGLGLGSQGITFNNMTTLNLNLGPGGTALVVNVQEDLPEFSNINAGKSTDTLTLTYQNNLDGIVNFNGFATTTSPASIGGSLNGTLNFIDFPHVPLLTIGSVAPSGVLTGTNVGELDIAGNMSGQVTLGGTLTKAVIHGGTAGAFVANLVGTISTYAGYGPVVLQVQEAGIERRVEAATPNNPYPLANPFTVPVPPISPGQVTFMSLYEGLVSNNGSGGSPTTPQITMRVIQPSHVVAAQQYDLSFVTWSPTSKFNLARLDVAATGSGIANAGIRNVAVEGDMLSTITPEAQSFFGLTTNLGGIRLPLDKLTGVGVSGYVPQKSIQSASIQGLSFGSMTLNTGKVVEATTTSPGNAALLLAPTTAFAQAVTGTTFRVPFADNHNVAFYYDALANQHVFDVQDMTFADENLLDPTEGATRGGIDALITTSLALAGTAAGSSQRALINTVAINGDGASFTTGQWVTSAISSTGALGDVTLSNGQGLTANITAPSIFGSIKALSGPIAGTIETTGTRYDPVTGASTSVGADIGRLVSATGNSTIDTQILAGSGGITGRIIDGGKLISQVTSNGPISGTIAAEGDIGVEVSGPNSTTLRYGGVSSQGLLSGQLVSNGNIVGDLTFQGGMVGGQIDANGSILGNVKLNGSFSPTSSIVAGGSIGSPSLGTGLTLSANNVQGLVAANGAVRFSTVNHPTVTYQNLPEGPSASAIDALFAALNTDMTGLELAQLQTDPRKLRSAAGSLIFGTN